EGSKGVVLDLSRIDRVDSAGIGILTLSAGKLRKAGGQLRLAGAQGAVNDVVKLTKIDTIVSCHPDLDSALRAFGPGASPAQG
ncbi:MAG TPA: STAS domain-containing protein, partial [Terriglobales bacterium]|nr:STAS domain-containing protein [Terriglobales bacterium]